MEVWNGVSNRALRIRKMCIPTVYDDTMLKDDAMLKEDAKLKDDVKSYFVKITQL